MSDLLIPIATPNSNDNMMKYYSTSADSFTKRSSYFMDDKNELYMELEDKNKTVLMLTSLLQKVNFNCKKKKRRIIDNVRV